MDDQSIWHLISQLLHQKYFQPTQAPHNLFDPPVTTPATDPIPVVDRSNPAGYQNDGNAWGGQLSSPNAHPAGPRPPLDANQVVHNLTWNGPLSSPHTAPAGGWHPTPPRGPRPPSARGAPPPPTPRSTGSGSVGSSPYQPPKSAPLTFKGIATTDGFSKPSKPMPK